MPRDEDAFLLDMMIASHKARTYVRGMTFTQFRQSDLHQSAVQKQVEIIGEAASQISSGTRRAHPEIPWQQIIGLRNRIVHAYYDVVLDTLWRVVQDEVPLLMAQLAPLVPPETA
jgi:uncharacterized protein with HEPN domain